MNVALYTLMLQGFNEFVSSVSKILSVIFYCYVIFSVTFDICTCNEEITPYLRTKQEMKFIHLYFVKIMLQQLVVLLYFFPSTKVINKRLKCKVGKMSTDFW